MVVTTVTSPRSPRRVTGPGDAEVAEWLQDQALRLGDGPRPGQVIILVLLWSAAAIFSLDHVDTVTSGGLCVVWRDELGWDNLLIWIIVGKNDQIVCQQMSYACLAFL